MPGRWFEDFQEGDVIEHVGTLAITQEDNAAFCALSRNTQPLHLDEAAAQAAGFPTFLVNGLYTFSATVGMTVADTTEGTLIANLGYDEVRHPAPVFPGDALSVRTEVGESRASSKPGRGIVVLRHIVTNQDGTVVCDYKRTVMVRSRPL